MDEGIIPNLLVAKEIIRFTVAKGGGDLKATARYI